MKTSGFVVFFAALSALASAATPVDSQITAATVYGDRAIVTRTARVDLAAGEQEFVFERLPASLLDHSLQVSGRGTATATILDVSARQTHVDATPSMRIKALEDEAAGLRRQDRGLSDKLKQIEQQRALLDRIEAAVTAPPPTEASAPRPSFDDWSRLLTFQSEQLSRLAAEQQALDVQREDLAAKVGAVEAQLNELRGRQPGGRSYKTVTVRVAGAEPGRLELVLAYAVTGAAWTPAYDARLRSAERAVELTYFGVVRNGTGEDWNQIALTLSTARPGLGGAAPEPTPWVVDVRKPMPLPAPAALSFGAAKRPRASESFNTLAGAGVTEGDMLAAPQEGFYVTTATATVDAATTSATFKIAAPATLPSDASTQKIAITTAKLAAGLQYQATPKQLESAFLSAYVANSTEFPLLAGAANTFLDDTFIAASRLKTVMPGETFELALGADEGVAIKRTLVKRFTEDTGLTNKGRRITYEWLVTVTNHKPTAERVVFKEPAPVSRDEKIVVKVLTPAEKEVGTPAAPREVTREADGVLVWRLDLKPGEKRELPLKFTIEHPADLAVVGVE
ncbi:MAG TPA: mucoidy inhibitor MuiA family protein [Opitutaceae bacterium]